MLSWSTLCQSLLVISLLFFAIPIRVKGPESETRNLFNQYIIKFNKTYLSGTAEYEQRYEAFKYTLFRIEEYNHNKTHNTSAKYGLTEFSDLTEQEFTDKHLDRVKQSPGIHPHRNKIWRKNKIRRENNSKEDDGNHIERIKRELLAADLPLQFDWRKHGIISPVQNQGLCGACWAFSTVQTIEAMNAKNNNLSVLSVQEVIDCSTNGNHGCSGGDICNLLYWLSKNNFPIKTEKEYPFQGKTDVCQMKNIKNSTGVRIKYYTCTSFVNSEKMLLNWIATKGPLAVAVNALSWQNYLGGVIQFHCSNLLNHAVQIIGYDLTSEIPHYIAKNSWGEHFGNGGYVYLAIGKNICGLANEVSMIEVE